MESLLPSEIARLVYGYLKEEKCNEAAQSFLEHSPHLVECLSYARQGKIFSTTVAMCTLMDILEEYCAIRRLVIERLQKMPNDTAVQIRQCTTLIEKLRHLLDASKAGQTLLVSIRVPPQGNGSQSSSNLQSSALSSRARARLFSNADRSKRTSSRMQVPDQDGNKQQNNKDAEESQLAPYNMAAVEATPLESLPGLADGRSMQITAKKDREESEKQMPKTSTPSKSLSDMHDPVPSCSFTEESHISSSPKRKHHSSSKRKCNNPTPMKNQVPTKGRWSYTEENDSNESVDFSVLSKALLGNTELHEKLAEKINSVICPTEQNQMDPAPQTNQCEGMDSELNNAIKTIVSRTESDPLFEKLLEELIGPEEEEMTPSPTEMQSESDDAATKVSGEEEIEHSTKTTTVKKKSLTPGRNQPQMEEESTTEVPLKQRLRSARQRKSDGAPTSVSPATTGKEKKTEAATVLSLEDQNAAAIQCIVEVNLNCKQSVEKEVAPSSVTAESSSATTIPTATNPMQTVAENIAKSVEQKVVNKSAETVVVETPKQPESTRTADIISTSAAMSGITAENDKPYVLYDGNVPCIDAGVPLSLSQSVNTTMSQLTTPLLVTMTQPTMAFTIPNHMETVSHLAAYPNMSTTVPVSNSAKPCSVSEGDIMAMQTVILCGSEPAMPHLINPASAVGNFLMTGNNRYVPIAPKDGNAAILAASPVETVPMIRNPLTEGELQTVISGNSGCTSTRRAKSVPKEKQPNKQNKEVQQPRQEQQSITLYGSGDAVAEVSAALSLPPISLESPEFKKPSPEKANATQDNPEAAVNKSNTSAVSKESEQSGNITGECLNAEKVSPEASGKSDDKMVKQNVPLSPQLLSLVNISTRNAGSSKQKGSPNKGASVATASTSKVSGSTPQTCLSQNRTLGASSKRLSSSTPRRHRNHVRALDFTTPPKSGIGSRRPNTSPKLTDCKRISPRCAEKFKKAVRRTGLFKSPPSVAVSTEAKPLPEANNDANDVTDDGSAPSKPNNVSEVSETEKEDQGPSLIKLSENEAPPIATRSPAVKLSGGWDKITGVGLILNDNASPMHDSSKEETLTNSSCSAPIDKQSRKEEKPHKEKNTRPKEVIKSTWDADLRSLLSASNDRFIKIPESPEKTQKRKSKRISKSAKLKKISEETEGEAKQVEENLINSVNNSKENAANCDNSNDIPNNAADAEGPNEGVEEGKQVLAKCDDSDKPTSSKSASDLKVDQTKKTQGASKKRIQKSKKIVKDKLNEKKDCESSKDDITEPNQDAQETESGSSCIEKVIQSPTKLNASKRTLVHHNSQLCQKLNMEESENNTETLIVRTEESDSGKTAIIATEVPSSANKPKESQKENTLTAIIATEVSSSANKPKESQKENASTAIIATEVPSNANKPKESQKQSVSASLSPPILEEQSQRADEIIDDPHSGREETPVLDTPRKIDAPVSSFWGADVSLIAPITPRIISPSVEDTPLTKLVRDRASLINFSTIQTPSFPPTPNIALTPQSFKSGASDSPTSYATRPTDYSSCSSYYKPSTDSENVNEKVLEQVLISECQRIESVSTPSKKKEEVVVAQENPRPEEAIEHSNDLESDDIISAEVVECEATSAVKSATAARSEPLAENSEEEMLSAKTQVPQNELQNIVQTKAPSLSSEPTSNTRKRTKSGASTDGEAGRHVPRSRRRRTVSNIEEKTKEQMIEDHMEDAKLKLFGQNSSCDEDSHSSESETEAPESHRYPLRSREKQNDKVNDKVDVESEVKDTVSKPCTNHKVPIISEKVVPSEKICKSKVNVPVVKEATHSTPSAALLPKDHKMCLELEEKKRRTIAKLKGFQISSEIELRDPVEPSAELQTLTYNIQNVPRSVEALVPKTKLETSPKKNFHLSVEAIAERLAREKNALPAPKVKDTSAPAEESSEEFPALRLSTDEEVDSETSRPQSRYAMVESRLAALHGENENESFGNSAVASTPLTAADLCNDLETPTKSDTDDDKEKSETNRSRYMKKRLKDLLGDTVSPIKDTAHTCDKSSLDAMNTGQPCEETSAREAFVAVDASNAEKVHCKSIAQENLQANAKENSKSSYNRKTLVDGTLYVEIIYQDDGPKGNATQVDLSQFETSFVDDENKIIKIEASNFQELFSYFPPVEIQNSKEVKRQPAAVRRKSRADVHETQSHLRNRVHKKYGSPQRARLVKPGAAWNRAQPPQVPCVSRSRPSHWPSGKHRESPSPPRWHSRGRSIPSPCRMTRRDSLSSHSRFSVHRRSRSHSMDRRKRSPSPSYHRRRKPSPPPRNLPPGKQKKSMEMISPLNLLYEQLVPEEERESLKATRNVSRHTTRSHKVADRETIKRSRRKEANDAMAQQKRTSSAAEHQGPKTKELLYAEDDLITYAAVGSAKDSCADDAAVQENQNQSRDHCGQSHTLPPKKRKASSDEAQTSLESKRPRTEVPKDLLKKVDLDHLLDFVHGEKLG